MSKLIFILAMTLMIHQISAQTFQYSRGWTNGKRSGASSTDVPPLRQMIPNSMLFAANELNNRERLLQHIIKNPCEVRMALMTSHNFKLPNDDLPSVDTLDDDTINRFKREMSARA